MMTVAIKRQGSAGANRRREATKRQEAPTDTVINLARAARAVVCDATLAGCFSGEACGRRFEINRRLVAGPATEEW
jgi:hypothetical protein